MSLSDANLSKLRSIRIYAFMTLVFFVIVEFLCFGIMELYYSINIDDGRNPMQYSDETIAKLYNSNEVEVYRRTISECWDSEIRKKRYEPLVEYVEDEYAGEFVNISDKGYRHNRHQYPLSRTKEKDTIRIFVFGGSTTFGYGVKDSETIPSYLQDYLEQRTGVKVAVYNFGAGYWYSTMERIRFSQLATDGYVADYAVFIDGLNDFSFYYLPDMTPKSREIAHRHTASPWTQIVTSLNSMTLIEKVLRRFGVKKPNLTGKVATKGEIKRSVDRLDYNRELLKRAGELVGTTAIFVHQPSPYFRFDENTRAVPLTDSVKNQISSVAERIESAYELIEERKNQAYYQNLNMVWLQEFNIEGNMYVDYVHYSPAFNKAIADKIGENILSLL